MVGSKRKIQYLKYNTGESRSISSYGHRTQRIATYLYLVLNLQSGESCDSQERGQSCNGAACLRRNQRRPVLYRQPGLSGRISVTQ